MGSVLLIGGYGGIGEKLTAELVAKGCNVLIAGRDAAKAEALAALHGQKGFALDASSESAMAETLGALNERYGPLEGVVNLVGSIVLKPLERTSFDEFKACITANLETAFLTVKYAAPLLAQNGGGSIVLMSSVAARFGLPNHEAIAAAKGGVQGLVLSAAASYAGKGVRVNAVAPALVATPLSQKIVGSEEARKASAAMHPLGRIGEAEDVAALLSWLLDPSSSWMTGQVIGLDGGMSTVKSRR